MTGLRYAIVEATVPSTNGTVDYTSTAISSWSSGGLAIVFVSGDTGALTFGGFLSLGLVNHSGTQLCTDCMSIDDSISVPLNRSVHGNDCVVFLGNQTTSSADFPDAIARAAFSSALTNGVRLNWNITGGVGSRTFKIVVVLIDGLTNVAVKDSNDLGPGFQTDGAILFPSGNSTYGTTGTGVDVSFVSVACTGLGGVLRDGSLTQKCAYCFSDDNTDPLVSRGGRRTADWSVGSAGTTQDVGTVTAIGATTITASGTTRGIYSAMKSATADYSVAIESLDGTTGSKSFTGLGKKCGLIVGFICGSTTDNTFEADSSTFSRFAYFVTDGTTTISLGFAQRHTGTVIAAGNHTDTYSSYSNGSILVLDNVNATDFLATVTSIDATGLTLNVTNGMSGTMSLFGFTQSQATIVAANTEQIADAAVVNLISRRILSEVEQISDSIGGMILADGLTALGPTGAVFQGGAVRGSTFQGGAEAGVVEEGA